MDSESVDDRAERSTGNCSLQTLSTSSTGVSTTQALGSSLTAVLSTSSVKDYDIKSDEKNFPLVPCVGHRAGDDGIGYLSALPSRVSVIGPCCEYECNKESENCRLEMFDKVGDDIIGDDESDCQSDTSGEPEGLTDSSSEDDTVAPGGHVWRVSKGAPRLRRVRRVTRHRPHGAASHDKQVGQNAAAFGSDCHTSDDDCIDDLFPEDQEASGGSYAETIEPNTQNKRTSLYPSSIEETAMIINALMNSNEDSRSGHNYVSSVSDFTPISDRSCLGRISATPLRMAQLAETRSPSDTSGGISLLQEIRRSGISAVNNPDDWIALDVTVDSGACVTVMPSGLCPGIQIMENDLSRNGVEYEVANGESIANLGEKRCQVMTIGSMSPKKIVFQIADVHKPLLSVTACSDMGYDCYLGKEGGSLRDRVTGEIIPLERRGSLYTLRMWVRQWSDERPSPGFPGPA